MSVNIQALTLGYGELYLDDQRIGPVTDIRIAKEVERYGIETAEYGELTLKHLIPVRRGYSVSMNLKELAPPALSYFFSGGASAKLPAGASQLTEYLRLYPNVPSSLKFSPVGSITVKSVALGITYAQGVDYSLDSTNRQISMLDGGSIIPGELLEVTYQTSLPPAREISLSEQPVKTAKIEILHRYPDGESTLSIVLRKVELDASGIFSFESEELIGVPISGRCLADENYPDAPFGYIRIYGTVMSEMNPR